MERKLETRYTKSALEQLELFKKQQVNLLEDKIISSKAYPGAEFIEITGADIQESSKDFIVKSTTPKSKLKYLIIYLYFIIGLGLMLFGFFYQDLMNIINNQPKQGLYILMGLTMTVLSGILLVYTRYRENKFKHLKDEMEINRKIEIHELETMLKKIEEIRNIAAHNKE